jgi:hypothetical protein
VTVVDGPSRADRSLGGVAHFELYVLHGTVRWRLLSANNRDTGQSAGGFATVEACRAELDRMLRVIGELQPLHTVTANQRWEWRLALGDVVLARSSRSFDRRLRCAAACDWFIRVAPAAAISDSPRVVHGRSQSDVISALDRSSPRLNVRDQRRPGDGPNR